jgi:hypothetical protein
MKSVITQYLFSQSSAQLTFSSYTGYIEPNRIWYIRNTTRNVDVYKAGVTDAATFQVTGVNGEILVFPGSIDVSTWDDSDTFLIIYEHLPFWTDLNTQQVVTSWRVQTSHETNSTGSSISGGNATNVTLWEKSRIAGYIKKVRIHFIGGSGTVKFYTVDDPLAPAWGYDLEWLLIHTNEIKFGTGTFPANSGGNSIAIEIDVSSISNIKMDVSGFVGSTLSYGVVESQQEIAIGSHTRHRALAAGTINATVVKATPAKLYRVNVYNAAAAVKFLKLYNKATTPAPGTDTSLLVTKIPIAPNSSQVLYFDEGHAFTSGLSYAITNLIADNDATAVTASDVELTIYYR